MVIMEHTHIYFGLACLSCAINMIFSSFFFDNFSKRSETKGIILNRSIESLFGRNIFSSLSVSWLALKRTFIHLGFIEARIAATLDIPNHSRYIAHQDSLHFISIFASEWNFHIHHHVYINVEPCSNVLCCHSLMRWRLQQTPSVVCFVWTQM